MIQYHRFPIVKYFLFLLGDYYLTFIVTGSKQIKNAALQGPSVTFNVAEESSSTGGAAYPVPFDISATPDTFPVMYAEVLRLLSISKNEVI